MSTSPLSPGTSSGLDLGSPGEWYHGLCNFMCASILLHLEGFVSFMSSILFGSFNLSSSSSSGRFPDPEKKNLMKNSHLGLKVPRSLTLCIRVDLCIFSHLLKEVLIPPGKNKTTTTIFDTNLKQA